MGNSTKMHSDRNIEDEMEIRCEEAINQDEWLPQVRGSPEIKSSEEYGDCEFFADELVKKGKPSTATTLFSAKRRLVEFLSERNPRTSLTEIGTIEAVDFVDYLDQEFAVSTAKMYVSVLNQMAQFYTDNDYYSGNPFSEAELGDNGSDRDSGILDSKRVKVPDKKLREAISGQIDIILAIVVTLLKTGMRRSELVNLRREDVYIDHPLADQMLPEPRSEIQDKPDSIFISSEHGQSNTESGGTAFGNKRKCKSVLPIDDELKQILVWYLSISPINRATDAFFIKDDGTQFTSDNITYHVGKWAEKQDLPHQNDDELKNVTPHWFRSKFTTQIYTSISTDQIEFGPERFVKGLRGDKGSDVIDEYLMKYNEHREPLVDAMTDIGLSTDY